MLWIGAITKKQLDKVKRKLQQFDVVFCNLLKGIKVVRRSPFGTWYRKLCGEAGLEDSTISNKMRMRHLASGTGLLWLLIVVNWWNIGETGLNPLVWFEMVWLNHSSRIIFIMSLIIVIVLLLRYMVPYKTYE